MTDEVLELLKNDVSRDVLQNFLGLTSVEELNRIWQWKGL